MRWRELKQQNLRDHIDQDSHGTELTDRCWDWRIFYALTPSQASQAEASAIFWVSWIATNQLSVLPYYVAVTVVGVAGLQWISGFPALRSYW